MPTLGGVLIETDADGHTLHCHCNTRQASNLPYTQELEEYDITGYGIVPCDVCHYYPWIRLGKREPIQEKKEVKHNDTE